MSRTQDRIGTGGRNRMKAIKKERNDKKRAKKAQAKLKEHEPTEPSEYQLERQAEQVGIPLWERV
jgi:hypothetical protein